MARLVNSSNGQAEDVPDDQVHDALASGSYSAAAGAKIPAINPYGKPVFISAEEAPNLFQTGEYRYETEEQERLRKEQAHYDDQNLAAGAAGAARGLTFGLSDAALTKTGLVEPGTLAKLKQYNPNVSLAGEAVGTIAPMVLSGGSSLLGQGARVAGSGVIGVARAGAATEGAVARLLAGETAKSIGAKIAAKAAATAAGSAVEGAFYGAGQIISEAALGREDITAQKVMAHIGFSALVGGIAGSALSATADTAILGASAAAKALSKGAAKADEATETLKNVYARAISRTKADQEITVTIGGESAAAAGAQASAQASAQSESKMLSDVIRETPLQDLRKKLAPTPEERDKIATGIYESVKGVDDTADELIRASFSKNRPEEVRRLLVNASPDAARMDAFTLHDEIENAVAAMRAEPELYDAGKNLVRNLELKKDGFARRLTEASDAPSFFGAVDDFKREIDKLMPYGRDVSPQLRDTVDMLKSIRTRAKGHLENVELYGEAATRQAAFNDAANRYFATRKEFLRSFGENTVTRAGKKTRIVSPIRVNTYLNQVGAARGASRQRALQEYLDAAQSMFEQAGVTARTAGSDAATGAAQELVQSAGRQVLQATESLQAISKVRALDNGLAFLEMMRTGGLGHMAGDAVKGAAGAVLGATAGAGAAGVAGAAVGVAQKLSATIKSSLRVDNSVRLMAGLQDFARKTSSKAGDAAEKMRRLVALERAAQQTSARAASAVERFLRRARTATKETATTAAETTFADGFDSARIAAPLSLDVLERVSGSGRRASRTAEDGERKPENRLAEFAELARDPAALQGRLSKSLDGLGGVAPKITGHLTERAVTATRFLHEKAPRPPVHTDTALPFRAKSAWEPAPLDLARWARYVAAVEDPMSVLDDMQDGRITPEGVEALRAIYPALYDEVLQSFTRRYDEMQDDLPYSQRVSLSALFGVPFDETMRPGFMATIQASYDSQQEPEQSGPASAVRPTASGLGKLQTADRAQTSSERLLSR